MLFDLNFWQKATSKSADKETDKALSSVYFSSGRAKSIFPELTVASSTLTCIVSPTL